MERTNTKAKPSNTKPNNIVTVPTSLDLEFFKWWCIFLRPFINLTNREIDVIASFLKQRWELSKNISDPAILDTMVMSEATKNKVIEECNITQSHFYVVMSNLRKNNIIVNNTIHPRLIPNIRKDDNGCFQLLILFKDKKNFLLKKIDIMEKIESMRNETEKHILISEDDWNEIEVFLDSVENLFVSRLRAQFSGLTKKDLRLMMLLRLKMPQKALALIYGISEKAIKQKLFLYKAKVGIEKEQKSLREFMENY